MDEFSRNAAQFIANYERGIMPEDRFMFSACHQLAEIVLPHLFALSINAQDDQFVNAAASVIHRLAAHNPIVAALCQTLLDTTPSEQPQVYHAPVTLVLNPVSTIIQRNQYTLSGDFRGAIVNVAATLEGTAQYIQEAALEGSTQDLLVGLLRSLKEALQHVPETHSATGQTLSLAIMQLTLATLGTPTLAELPASLIDECAQAAAQLKNIHQDVHTITTSIIAQLQATRFRS